MTELRVMNEAIAFLYVYYTTKGKKGKKMLMGVKQEGGRKGGVCFSHRTLLPPVQ